MIEFLKVWHSANTDGELLSVVEKWHGMPTSKTTFAFDSGREGLDDVLTINPDTSWTLHSAEGKLIASGNDAIWLDQVMSDMNYPEND